MDERPPIRRCAIYTRKSSDEGLDQSFNSLDAQRDACAAYIASQRLEGWVLVEKHYDDGGLSGGSLHRPALQTLLADMASGAVDIVVVYKIDRLTRSLADFAKLTEIFDKHQTSFVAVTQQFNTSTSMGRLTLNVLLSFAQFEREVAGERIRDKIAASKRRGMWVGGHPPIGYDVLDKKLVANAPEAETVRHIYRRYLELKTVRSLMLELKATGIRSKARIRENGLSYGDAYFSRGALYLILKNKIYRGFITHKGNCFPGEHEAILDEALFNAVQTMLEGQGPGESARQKRKSHSLLGGIAFDPHGNRLQLTHCKKRGDKAYRYYTSANLVHGNPDKLPGLRIPAGSLEGLVLGQLAEHLRSPQWLTHAIDPSGSSIPAAAELAQAVEAEAVANTGLLGEIVKRIEVASTTIHIKLNNSSLRRKLALAEADAQPDPEIKVTGQFIRCGKQVRLVIGKEDETTARVDERLVREIIRAQKWFEDLVSGRDASISALAKRHDCSAPYVSRKISLAFLAPDIVQTILDGTQPTSLTPERLKKACPLPSDWREQRLVLLR